VPRAAAAAAAAAARALAHVCVGGGGGGFMAAAGATGAARAYIFRVNAIWPCVPMWVHVCCGGEGGSRAKCVSVCAWHRCAGLWPGRKRRALDPPALGVAVRLAGRCGRVLQSVSVRVCFERVCVLWGCVGEGRCSLLSARVVSCCEGEPCLALLLQASGAFLAAGTVRGPTTWPCLGRVAAARPPVAVLVCRAG
jgi:hypothetical protein